MPPPAPPLRLARGSVGALRPALALALALAGGCGAPVDPAPAVPGPGPEILVLGTAQDGGVPHAGCSCARCAAARRDPGRVRRVASLAILLPASDAAFLIDATPDLPQQLDLVRQALGRPAEGTDRKPLAGIFLTHAHMGHYLGLAHLGYEVLHAREIPLRASPRMVEFLESNAPWDQLVRLRNVVPEAFDPAARVEIPLGDGVSIEPVPVPHRGEYTDTVGYLVRGPGRRVLYLPDVDPWGRWERPIEDLLRRLDPDLALLDGCFYSGQELPGRNLEEIRHPLIVDSIERLLPLAVAARPRILFTHLNHSNPAVDPDSDERRRIERLGFAVAEDGQRIALR